MGNLFAIAGARQGLHYGVMQRLGSPPAECYNFNNWFMGYGFLATRLPSQSEGSMSGASSKFASLLLTACLCVAVLPSAAVAQKGGVRKPKKKQPKSAQTGPVVPAYTPAPLQPLPLEQVPAVAPHVHFADGELTITAHNSTLSDVLKEVREQTGADLDIPPNANERVVADLGPGPARQVLADLLNGTHFNYLMVGSSTDPSAIQSIVLTPRTGGPDTTTSASNRPGPPQRGFAQPPVVGATPADATPENDGAEDADAPDDQTAEQGSGDQPNQTPGQQTPKTPEQLLQELQRQQQQQQNPQQPGQAGQPPQGILPNQPPTTAPPNQNKPE